MDALVTAAVVGSRAVAILRELDRDGFRVDLAAGDTLRIAPRSRLTPERMRAIAECKEALRMLLLCRDDGVQVRRVVFARQLATTPAPGVPAFLFRLGLPYVAGSCFSCGERLERPRFGRCPQCAIAWRLAAGVPISSELAEALDSARVA